MIFRILFMNIILAGIAFSQNRDSIRPTPNDAASSRTITIIQPNGGELLRRDRIYTILWSVINEHGRITLLFSRDGGTSYPDTIARNIPSDSTHCPWRTPYIFSQFCLIRIELFDSLDNLIASDISDNYFTIGDTCKPEIFTLIYPENGSYLQINRPTFIWHSSRDTMSGIMDYHIRISSLEYECGPDTTWTPIDPLQDSTYTWRVLAFDSAGNVRYSNGTWFFTIDCTAPMVYLISPSSGVCLNDTMVDYVWHRAVDHQTGIWRYIHQSAYDTAFTQGLLEYQVFDTVWRYGFADTVYYWRVQSSDNMGNMGPWSEIRKLIVDTHSLVPELILPGDGSYLNDPHVTFAWSNTQALYYVVQADTSQQFSDPIFNDTLIATTTQFDLFESPSWRWRARSFYNEGHQSGWSAASEFIVDLSPPSVPVLVSPTNGSFRHDSLVPFTWRHASDSLSGIENYNLQCATDAGFIQMVLDTISNDTALYIHFAVDTVYYWRVRAADSARNSSGFSGSYSFELDTRCPASPLLVDPPDRDTLRYNLAVFTWQPVRSKNGRNSPVGYNLQIDSSRFFVDPVVDVFTSLTSDTAWLGEASYFWRVRAYDSAGNYGDFSNPFYLTIHLPHTDLSASPSSIDFGEVEIGDTVSRIITIANVGELPLILYSIDCHVSCFNYTPPPFPDTLDLGDTLDLAVRFIPYNAAYYTDWLSIDSNEPDPPVVYIRFTGTGMFHFTEPVLYPSPFIPSLGHTVLKWAAMPAAGEIIVYAMNGTTLWRKTCDDSGLVEWDAKDDHGRPLATGLYYYVILDQTGQMVKKNKFSVIR